MISLTGGAGFICSNLVLGRLSGKSECVITLDKLSYAGSLSNLDAVRKDEHHMFVHGDLNDKALVEKVLAEDKPRAIVHFAAESHVDRSISDRFGAATWSRTNAEATVNMIAKNRRNEQRMPLIQVPGGVMHLTAQGRKTWHKFASEVVNLVSSKTPKIIPIPSAEYPVPAKGSKNLQLNFDYFEKASGPPPHWSAIAHLPCKIDRV